MRTIKFRAWNGTKMLLSENADFYLMPNNKVQIPSSTGHEFYDRDYPIMQFTGLLDKNGKEIYEGDVVEFIDCDGRCSNCVVEFKDGGFYPFAPDYVPWSIVEVIGNIYENPELLEMKE